MCHSGRCLLWQRALWNIMWVTVQTTTGRMFLCCPMLKRQSFPHQFNGSSKLVSCRSRLWISIIKCVIFFQDCCKDMDSTTPQNNRVSTFSHQPLSHSKHSHSYWDANLLIMFLNIRHNNLIFKIILSFQQYKWKLHLIDIPLKYQHFVNKHCVTSVNLKIDINDIRH